MTFQEITNLICQHLGNHVIISQDTTNLQPSALIQTTALYDVCAYLRDTEGLYFDMLTCISGIDNFPQPTLEVVYHLYSIPYHHSFVLRVLIDRQENPHQQQKIPSLVNLWGGANWLERETAEMFGIIFDGHPDLRPLLLPADWIGFPLRKDYQHQQTYHGITVKY